MMHLKELKKGYSYVSGAHFSLMRNNIKKKLTLYYQKKDGTLGCYSHDFGLYDSKDGICVRIGYNWDTHKIVINYIYTDYLDAESPFILK